MRVWRRRGPPLFFLIEQYVRDPAQQCVRRPCGQHSGRTERTVAHSARWPYGSLRAVCWTKKPGQMSGHSFRIDLILLDEGLLAEFACLTCGMFSHCLPEDVVSDMIQGARRGGAPLHLRGVLLRSHRHEERPDGQVQRVRGIPTVCRLGSQQVLDVCFAVSLRRHRACIS